MNYNLDTQRRTEEEALSSVINMRKNINEQKKSSPLPGLFVIILACLPVVAYEQGLIPNLCAAKQNASVSSNQITAAQGKHSQSSVKGHKHHNQHAH